MLLGHPVDPESQAFVPAPRRGRLRTPVRVCARGQTRAMCRWLAYYGDKPIRMDKILYGPQHSLIQQSLSSTMGAEPTNGDGFGIGWYSPSGEPGIFKSMEPAWNDRNLRELAGHIESRLFIAHVRATTGTPVQQTNCHPFRWGKWLWVHNGLISDWLTLKRDLVLAVDPALYPLIEGTTDSEVLFFLAVTFGLEDDPPGAVQRAIGLVEEVGRQHGVKYPFQGTIATSNGEKLWAFRYSSEGKSRSLYFSTSYDTMKALYPDDARLADFDEESRVVVSEPLGDLPGMWNPVPDSSWGVVQPGPDELSVFQPTPPVAA
jgi:glutamine amidotransferase